MNFRLQGYKFQKVKDIIKLSDFKIKLQQGERKVIQDSNGLIIRII